MVSSVSKPQKEHGLNMEERMSLYENPEESRAVHKHLNTNSPYYLTTLVYI